MKLDNCKSSAFVLSTCFIITLVLKYVKEKHVFFKTKYELGCVNKPISHANEIMNMYKILIKRTRFSISQKWCERVKTLTFQKRLYYNFEVQCRNSLRKWVKL